MKGLKYLIIIVVMLSGIGCQKFFQEPNDLMREEDAYENMLIADRSLANLYATLWGSIYNGTQYYLLSGTTDEGESANMTGGGYRFNTGLQSPSDYPLGNRWVTLYDYVRRANIYLRNIQSVPEEDVNLKRQRIGEAKFLKAMMYQQLFKNFGRFVIIDEVLNISDELKRPRASLEECVNYIVNMAEEAAVSLPVEHRTSDLGRATRAAARALKAETLLFYASPLHNPTNNTDRWAAAAAAAESVLNDPQNKFSLYNDYSKLFLDNWNSEIIFAYNAGGAVRIMENDLAPSGYGGWAGINPSQQIVDAYQMANGLDPFNADGSVNVASGYNPAQPYANREPRFYATVLYNGAKWQHRNIESRVGGLDAIEIGSHNRSQTGYFLRKFLDESIVLNQTQNRAATWVLFRLGTLKLDYAEARNEATGPDNIVYANVNAIRARAGLPALPAGLSKDQMRERIRHERRIEMAFEDNRFWDVRRWKIGTNVFNTTIKGMRITQTGSTLNYQVVNVRTRVFDEKRYFFPIPQSELNRNPNMDQNPGW